VLAEQLAQRRHACAPLPSTAIHAHPTTCETRGLALVRGAGAARQRLLGDETDLDSGEEEIMSRRARKRRDRKKGGANHGKRPNT
jgi:hypothetical protein